MDRAHFLISLLNGLSIGLLLFMLASGLTLIFSMMGVLNFAHASFYMLGAYVGYALTRASGSFWLALVFAPLLVGLAGAAFERFVLRRVHRFGHVPELLVTFGLSYIVLELVQLVWGRAALDFQPPTVLRDALFTLIQSPNVMAFAWGDASAQCAAQQGSTCTTFPRFRAFGMAVALGMLLALWLLFSRTRTGLVVQAALKHPRTVEALGHNVPRLFMLVFAGGTALAALAGVIGGALRVTEPGMAANVGAAIFALIVIGGLGSLAGAFIASLALGLMESFAVGSDRSLADLQAWAGLQASALPFGAAVWGIKLSQVAAILPFVLLVAMLVLRPKGLLGARED